MGGDAKLEEGSTLQLDWTKLEKVAETKCGVVPVVVQDDVTNEVLIVAYANQAALVESQQRRVCCLWSTSRNKMWVKGETSGDFLDLKEIRVNCEQNSLLYRVVPRRTGACHTNHSITGQSRVSCYYRQLTDDGLENLDVMPIATAKVGRLQAHHCNLFFAASIILATSAMYKLATR